MYPDPYNTGGPFWSPVDGRRQPCPICGSVDVCPDAVAIPMPLPPVDLPDPIEPDATPLRLYRVTAFGYTTVVQLTDADAASYGPNAVLL